MDGPQHKEEVLGLCYRCECRARYMETGKRVRYECGMGGSLVRCPLYRPCIIPPIYVEDGEVVSEGVVYEHWLGYRLSD